MVVRPGCSTDCIGYIFRVERISVMRGACATCGTRHGGKDGDPLAHDETDDHGFQLFRLIKIDPPALPESVTAHEEATA
jgi:hypothetical protein